MQFDSHPQSSRPESFLVPFNSRPVAPLQNHALAPGEEILGKNPQLMFETHSEFIPHHRCPVESPIRCELTSECRLARGQTSLAFTNRPNVGRRPRCATSPCQ